MLQSPAARVPKLFHPPFTELFAAFDTLPGSICGVEAPAFWKCLTCALFDTSEPVQVMIRLKWFDVDLDRGILRMPESNVELMLSPSTVAALRTIEDPARTKVFPWVGSVESLHQAFNSLMAKAAVMAERGGGQ